MALTLAESAKLATDMVLAGVMETIIKEEHVLDQLPFIEVVGNNFVFNRLNTEPSIAFFAVGDTWTESTPDFTQLSVQLKILGGDADVDNFIQASRANVQDIEAAVIQQKAKALARKWADTFINGDTSVDTKAFDGIDKTCAGLPASQTVSMGTNGGTLTLAKLDELIDAVKTKNIALVISRRSRRTLQSLVRTSGAVLESRPGNFLEWVQMYNGVPVFINDYISDAKTVGTSSDCSTIYCFSLGEADQGVVGLSAPGGIQVQPVGELESKDATRHRVKWYSAIAVLSTLSLARLTGVRP
ncbi:MAG: major capsid protein [Chloroflexi bacterium RBG_16_68_14]|nr:MAG: major capsid protein [Chloroflexi bacterium RBG_16_68_14]